ncbi:uncharacterized protein ACNLHF_005183 [Anomaloglossus baeobatrachus]|uniref:uncharacterized protein LOC142274608 n=1 Tax=Anomaloglossus baeobatrachus TaxID=238106 RepID=UPI003F4F68E3
MSDRGSEVYVTRSHVSSSASRKSVSSAAIATARAKAEAAKVRAAFAEQELKLKTEKARLEADLAKLAVDTEAAAAEAEVQALEEAARSDSKSFRLRLGPELSHRDISQRTSDYVLKHTASDDRLHSAPRERLNPAIQPSTFIQQTSHVKHEGNSVHLTPSVSPAPKFVDSYYTANRPKMEDPDGDYHGDNVFDGNNNSLGPHHSNMYQDHPLRNQELPDFLKFFARRELLTKGLLKFNDRPESYRAWRASFRNATAGLDISANEEIDLLVKWLGNESAEHAKRIRDISINHPSKGLCLLWERLDECYGSSERIEESLFKRLEDFPKISNKSFHMLRELSDLLVELQVAKFEGDLPGLASLDAARGIKPIVNKLPYSLQEKWLNRGSDYKQRHNVPFPPFHVFVDFVRQQAKIRNDPSFDLSTADPINPRTGKPAPVRNPRGSPITVHKTNVSATDSSRKTHSTTEPEGSLTIDPDKECPLHKRPHPLQQCRSFRGKSLKDRRIFLRENNICYRCCASTSHLGRDCNASITCSECNSQEHSTALHPEPAPQNSTHIDRLTEHGGEETESTPPEVSPQCTQVCGEGLTNKSCSKICLVTVYPMGYREKAVKLYAILDDQSNRSLASSAFFDIFGIKGLSCSYSLKTCTGVSEESGRRATGYQIESLDGKTSLPLPTLIECNAIPNNREEIPTPEAALHHPHLRNIAHLIPALNSQAKLVLLLGRDIIRVHKVRKQINGPHNSPYAQKLDLGWVVIGDVCLGKVPKPNNIQSLYTNTSESGRPSFFLPCPNKFLVKENLTNSAHLNGGKDRYAMDELCDGDKDHLGCAVFQKTKEDYKLAHSIEDETFLEIMDQGFHKDENDSWVAPLPFKPQRPCLPNNKEMALKRLTYLKPSFSKKPEMEVHFFAFMDKIFKIPTDQNPADHATRAVSAPRLKDTNWLVGPAFLYQPVPTAHETHTHELFEPESDVELQPQVSTLSTTITNRHLDSSRFLRFSTWRSAYRALTCLIHVIRSFKNRQSRPAPCKGWHRCHKAYTVEELTQAKHAIICCVQHEAYTQTLESLRNHRSVPKDSPLKKLDPFVDTQGLLRVGGRISNAKLENDECTPIIVPHGHVAFLLVEHYHAQVRHQGRLITEGALREAGFWITGVKRLVSRVIFKCIICRKLRGSCQSQKMADLPADCLSTEPPFTNVGLDVFGPWSVVTRQTRGGHANSKRWAVLFTCLSIRAVQIEVIETMDTSSFINAFRRFISLRGHVKHIRSDRGSNFVGACGELKIPSNLDINQVERRLSELGCTWTFNPPHSSHMGGVWERMIGIARRILDSIFLQLGPSKLTHETLTTFMAEVVAIMNARPLVPISNDPDDLSLLTPSTLLTQKFNVSMPTSGEFTTKDLYKSQWKRVQMLADLFWTKWRKQYLSTLQTRDKWQDSRPNMKPGNVVLVKNTQSKRNEWPLGLVTKVFPSQDGQVRKVEIKIPKQSGKLFLRPVSELILLL